MPISQMVKPCWTQEPAPGRADEIAHFPTEADAQATDPVGAPVRERPAPCWTVTCDGDCEITLDTEGEGYTFHYETAAEAEEGAASYDMRTTTDGRVFCSEDAPDCATALSVPCPECKRPAGVQCITLDTHQPTVLVHRMRANAAARRASMEGTPDA